MAVCEKCAHKPVCGKYAATGGHVRECEHFMELVRCKECKHWHEETGWCDHHSWFIEEDGEPCHPWESNNWKMLSADDFCSYGERKAENDTKCIKNEVSKAEFAENLQNGSLNTLFDRVSNIDWGAEDG